MKEILISVFEEVKETKKPFVLPLQKIFDRIKNGSKSLDTIKQIRQESNKEKRDLLKMSLPCIIFGGTFSQRSKNGLLNHSGLMVIDFDDFESAEELNESLENLKQNKYLLAAFISPSGNGIKGVIKIPPCDQFKHELYFKTFNKEFQIPKWDAKNCNVDRVCYESYDPDIYINWDCEVYSPSKLIDEGYTKSERKPLIPIDNEDFIITKIMNFNWSKDFVEGERNAFIFDIAGAFCEYGISQQTAEGYILNNVVHGNFSEKEAITAIKSAYKKRQSKFGSKYFEDHTKVKNIKSDLKHGTNFIVDKYNITKEVVEEITESEEIEDFWFINEKGKVVISLSQYIGFLERHGFKKYYHHENIDKTQYVFIESNKVEITSIPKIKDFVLSYLKKRGEKAVWEYCGKNKSLFSDQYLEMMDSIELSLLKDKSDKSFIAYKNGILEISKSETKLIDYIDIKYYIWKKDILNRDFVLLKEHENDYQKFINNISSNNPLPFECTIGYLLSTYKNRSNNKAVILNDEIITDNPEGGTGKGLFVQGISQMRNTAVIDGKQFDSSKSFPYQTISLDTKIMVFDDVKKNFNFEEKFSLVTEGITLERKNKDAIKLGVHESPKLVISSNYALKGAGNSHDRRRHELEFAQHYGKNLTPDAEFGKQLFDEWTDEEFQKFDNYMVYCLQCYLQHGLIEQNAKNIKLRRFIAETSMDFYEFISDEDNFQLNVRNDKRQIHQQFISQYPDFKSYKQNTFTKWVNKYAIFINKNFEQNASNGTKWFGIYDSDKSLTEQEQNDLYNEIFG